jgi:Flp pilus assembly secretin CpaC
MRSPSLAFLLLAVVPSLANGEEPAPSEPARKTTPFVQEVTGSGPSERLLHLKAALVHLERAGFEEPEIAKAAAMIGDLIDAEKSKAVDKAVARAPQAVDVQIKVFEVNKVKLRDAGVDLSRMFLSKQDGKLAAQLEAFVRKGFATIISEPRIQTLSGREATFEVGDDARKISAKILPTVLKGNKIRLQLECNLSKAIAPLAADGPPVAEPQINSTGVVATLEVAAGEPAALGGFLTTSKEGPKVVDAELIFVVTPNLVIAREAKAPTPRFLSEPKIKR